MTNTNEDILAAYEIHGSVRAAAAALGMAASTYQGKLERARVTEFRSPANDDKPPFELPTDLPSALAPVEEIRARRCREFMRVHEAHEARRLIPVKVNIDGPIGISHGGDPHLDDAGTNMPLIERHVEIINRTEGLFGANVGDLTNNWVGRLGRLYGEQSTSAAEGWALAEWYVNSIDWLYLIPGNHDVWSGAGDPVKWMLRQQPGVYEGHGARLALQFPNGREVRVNARHDFKGHSQWNTAHGVAKAAQMGWRDHILTCGHLHTFGYNVLKDPSSGLISHAIRVASYKWHDRYAEEKGLPDQNISENVVTIIDPEATAERRLVRVFFDLEDGADYLKFLRRHHAFARRAA